MEYTEDHFESKIQAVHRHIKVREVHHIAHRLKRWRKYESDLKTLFSPVFSSESINNHVFIIKRIQNIAHIVVVLSLERRNPVDMCLFY